MKISKFLSYGERETSDKRHPLIPAQFVRGSFLSAASAVIVGISGYLTRRFMANHLPENDYAFFYSTLSLLTFLLILTQVGLSDVILYELPGLFSKNKKEKAAALYGYARRIQLLLSTIGFLILCVSIPILKNYYYPFPVSNKNLLIFFTLIWGLTMEYTTQSALNSIKLFGAVSLIRIMKSVLFCCAAAFFLWRRSLLGIIFSNVIITTVCTFSGDYLFLKKIPFAKKEKLYCRREVLRDAKIFILLAVGYAMIQDFGTITVAFFSSASEVVLFNIALPIAMIVYSFAVVLQVFLPMIADSYERKDKRQLRRLITLMFLLVGGSMLLAFPVLYFCGDFIITLLFSAKFTAAKISTIFLVEAAILSMMVRTFLNFFNTIGQQTISAKALIPTICTALLVFPLLSWKSGAAGAAGATLLTTIVWVTVYYWYYRKFIAIWKK